MVVTGPAGAGRSTSIRALEDFGFEAIDNVPLSLMPRLIAGPPMKQPLVVGIDPRNRDLVFRAIGRPGVVLVTEGPTGRARKLAEKERRRVGPRVRNVPIHIIAAGPREDQVPLNQVSKHVRKLENKLTKQEVSAVHQRLSTLRSDQLPIPKGVDPMRARPDHKALRGR